jgi:hypothetical protein
LNSIFKKAALPAAIAAILTPTAWSEDDSAGLEEVVVTAQKREQNLQDVPVAITAINAEQLTDRKIDLQRLTFKLPHHRVAQLAQLSLFEVLHPLTLQQPGSLPLASIWMAFLLPKTSAVFLMSLNYRPSKSSAARKAHFMVKTPQVVR